jgi:hypothetical protein
MLQITTGVYETWFTAVWHLILQAAIYPQRCIAMAAVPTIG